MEENSLCNHRQTSHRPYNVGFKPPSHIQVRTRKMQRKWSIKIKVGREGKGRKAFLLRIYSKGIKSTSQSLVMNTPGARGGIWGVCVICCAKGVNFCSPLSPLRVIFKMQGYCDQGLMARKNGEQVYEVQIKRLIKGWRSPHWLLLCFQLRWSESLLSTSFEDGTFISISYSTKIKSFLRSIFPLSLGALSLL